MPRSKQIHPFHLVAVGIPSYNPVDGKPVLRVTAKDDQDGRFLEADFTPEELQEWARSFNKWADLFQQLERY